LRSIASSDADVFPICESYAPALDRIDDFARTLIRTEYPLELALNETITSVVVTTLEGETRTLDAEQYSHDRERSLLSLDEGAIGSGDGEVEVEIELLCDVAR
jgi:hypothetical protein